MNNKIQISNVVLISSKFQRERNFNFEGKDISPELDVVIDSVIDDTEEEIKAETNLTIKYSLFIDGKKEVEASVMMAAMFLFKDYKDQPIQKFCEINGAAIIYPYIRVHLTNISVQAGIRAINLPPINFIKMYNDKNDVEHTE